MSDAAKLPPPSTEIGNPSSTAKIVVGVVIAAFLAFLLWSVMAPLNRGVVAPGRVDTETRRTIVKHKDGGTLAEVHAREGDRVKAGDILAVMDDREARVQLGLLNRLRIQNLIESAVRTAEASRAPAIRWPDEVQTAIADPNSEAAGWARVQQQAFDVRKRGLAAKIAILGEQRQRLQARVSGLSSTDQALRTQSALLQQEATSLRELENEGFAPRNRVLAIERNAADVRGRVGDNRSAIEQSRISMGEVELQSVLAQSELVEIATQRLSQLNTERSQLDDRISGLKVALERATIKSPIDGIILMRAAAGPGAVLQPTETVFEIVPSDKLVIRAQVRPADIERISQGQNVTLRFSGLNPQKSPKINGFVTYVDGDVQTDRATQANFYEMRVEVPSTEMHRLGNQIIRPGMPVTVFVDGGARTAWDYIVEPIINSYERAFKE